MKRKSYLFITMIAMGMIAWQCTRDNTNLSQQPLKANLQDNVQALNNAVNAITTTDGYKMLSVKDNGLKSAEISDASYSDSILLENIKGTYEFHPSIRMFWCRNCLYRMFTRTGDSNNLVIQLPEEYVFSPWKLHYIDPNDTTLSNNFKITTTDYQYLFSHGMLYDYKLAASFDTDTASVGAVSIQSHRSSFSDHTYSSKYTFDNNYSISVSSASGDTATTSFALMDGSDTLLKETLSRIQATDSTRRERIYSLMIGNIEIRRTSASDSSNVQVYQDGTLQSNATIQIVDQDSTATDHSICKKRDIQITFADGTTATLSELLAPSKEILSGLVDSMHNIYFATDLIDYIAWNIYKNS